MSNIVVLSRRIAIASLISFALASTWVAPPAHADCVRAESRCGKDWAFCPDLPFLATIVGDGCSAIEPSCPKPASCPVDPRKSCGERWTEWRSIGDAVNNPCPAGCVPSERVGHDSRTTDEFFHMQYRERWACAGAPVSKDEEARR